MVQLCQEYIGFSAAQSIKFFPGEFVYIYIFFFLVRRESGGIQKKLSSEVGESQSFCAGSLRSIFRVDCDLGSPYTAGVGWFKAQCDLTCTSLEKRSFLIVVHSQLWHEPISAP